MNSGVYNRSLFRKKGTEARDQLRRMGGIMASSPELMQAGMMDQPPMGRPPMAPQTGQGEVRFMAPNLLQPTMPQQPMMPQQGMMQRPMPQQSPLPNQTMIPQPAMNLSAAGMVQPQMAYRDGGDVSLGSRSRLETRLPTTAAEAAAPATGSPSRLSSQTFDRAIAVGSNTAAAAAEKGLPADLQEQYARIDQIMGDPDISDVQKAKAVADTLGLEGAEEDPEAAVVNAAQQLGLDPAREARIDTLNKAMLGFAIAAGDSPRASENIANGMLAGLKQMRDTEERRARADLAARTGALEDEATSWFDTPRGKLATGYIEKMMEGTLDVETMVDTLNQLDADSPAGAKLGDEFRRALAAGATPPMPVQTRMGTPAAAPAAPTETTERDMSTLTKQARDKIAELEATDYDPAQKQQDIERVRQMYIEMGGNPDVLGG